MPQIVAESQKRFRHDVMDGYRWTTYRVRRLGQDEYERLHRESLLPPSKIGLWWVLETQHTKTERGQPPIVRDWELWEVGETPDAVILEMLGDTEFLQARSLHLAHAEAVILTRERTRLGREVYDLEQKLARAVLEAKDRREVGNREYSAAQQKWPPNSAGLLRAENRLRKKHGPHIAAAQEVVERLKPELEMARSTLEKAKTQKVVVLDQLDLENDIGAPDGDDAAS